MNASIFSAIARLTAGGWEVVRRCRGELRWWRAEKRAAGDLRIEVARSLPELERRCAERDARNGAPVL